MNNDELKMRGEQAARLLKDALLNESLDTMKRELYDQFCKTKHSETDKRQEIWALQRSADFFAGMLRAYVSQGEHATALMKKEIDERGKKNRGWRKFLNKER